MSEEREIHLSARNAQAARQGLEGHEERIQELEAEILHIRNLAQTLINEVNQLKQTNNMALAKLVGTGSTSGPVD